ncbi:hypothetical protein WG622_18030 [Cognatishimia sp. D5M38]|uniref:Uncharacterized protein n=1 Tax=Cognatishimia coralii TaxID=3083254 RepID=A0ABU8QL67_9RHOB|nr:hypothetical protein [Donghicola eburneus]MCI5040725.1 hypothetical protein [Donghicola eburneus]
MDMNSDFKLQLFGSVAKDDFPALSAALKLAKVEFEGRDTLLDLIVNGAGSFLTLKEEDLLTLESCLIKVLVGLGISFTLIWGATATRVPGIMTFSAQSGKRAMVAGLADQPEVVQMPNAYQEPMALAA